MIQLRVSNGWRDYELVDSGEGKKLERWGQYLTVRPEPRAVWKKSQPSYWDRAEARFEQTEDGGEWKYSNPPPDPWIIQYEKIRFKLKPTDFRHVGVFPEQSENWDWITRQIKRRESAPRVKILNLFAYTGGATIAAASAGGQVTHVDSSRPAMMWASENAKLSQIPKESVRWIQDDALKFVNREIRRGVKYDGIIMDPPRFGRGAGGEVWKLLENLPELVLACRKIMTDNPVFVLVNAYTADMSSLVLRHLLNDIVGGMSGELESGELGISQTYGEKVLPAGIFARWSFGQK